MHVLISLLAFRPGRIGGTETYLRRVIEQLPVVAPDINFSLLTHRGNANAMYADGAQTVVVPHSQFAITVARCSEAFSPFRDRSLEQRIAKLTPDVIWFPQQSIFPRNIAAPVVLTALDVGYLHYPQQLSWFDRRFRAAIYPAGLACADRIIAISDYTRQTLIDQCQVSGDKITAIRLGMETSVDKVEPYRDGGRPYLYYPASTYPHKNHLQLLETVMQLHRAGKWPYRLLLTGMQTAHWRRVRRRIRLLELDDVVKHLGYVTHAQTRSLFQGAAAVLFPSNFEGFGIPVYEAVHAQKKVIVANLPVFEELGVPTSCRIDFSDPVQLASALDDLGPTRLTAPPLSWSEVATATATVFREVAGCSPTGYCSTSS